MSRVAVRRGYSSLAQSASSSGSWQRIDPHNCLLHRYEEDQGASAAVDESQPLADWPITIKDNFCTKDSPTTCASKMLQGYQPSFDGTAVRALRQAGARFVGKTNLDEFAMGSANVHTHFGPVINPAGPASDDETVARAAGGSSGGAAASVRAGLCRVALGTDTGGSVRLPASHCGVWGFKPSYGLISRWGVVSYADSLDTVGILANSWGDVRQTFDVLSKPDERDPTCATDRTRLKASRVSKSILDRISQRSARSLEGVRIGIPQECFPAELNSQVLPTFQKAVEFLTSRGAEIVAVSLPETALALSAYMVMSSAEASSNLARYDGIRYGYRADDAVAPDQHTFAASRAQGLGREVRKRILLGAHALCADAYRNTFLRTQRIRKIIRRDFDRALRIPNVLRPDEERASGDASIGVDVLLHPCSVNSAPTIAGAKHESSVEEYVQDLLTVPSSLAGLPAVSMPTGNAEDGWPVGTMAVTQWGMESILGVVADVMSEYEGMQRWH